MNDDTPGIDELFAVARDAKAPVGAATRGWSRFEAAIAATPATGAATTAAAWLPAAKIGGVVAVVLAIAVPLATRDDARAPTTTTSAAAEVESPRARETTSEVAVMPVAPIAATTTTSAANEPPTGAKPSRTLAPSVATAAPSVATAAPVAAGDPVVAPQTPDALRLEADLLGRAWIAIRERDLPTVRTLLADHARRFPEGALLPERHACEIVVACLADARDATSRARAYLADHGGSHLAARVRSGCGLPAESTAR